MSSDKDNKEDEQQLLSDVGQPSALKESQSEVDKKLKNRWKNQAVCLIMIQLIN